MSFGDDTDLDDLGKLRAEAEAVKPHLRDCTSSTMFTATVVLRLLDQVKQTQQELALSEGFYDEAIAERGLERHLALNYEGEVKVLRREVDRLAERVKHWEEYCRSKPTRAELAAEHDRAESAEARATAAEAEIELLRIANNGNREDAERVERGLRDREHELRERVRELESLVLKEAVTKRSVISDTDRKMFTSWRMALQKVCHMLKVDVIAGHDITAAALDGVQKVAERVAELEGTLATAEHERQQWQKHSIKMGDKWDAADERAKDAEARAPRAQPEPAVPEPVAEWQRAAADRSMRAMRVGKRCLEYLAIETAADCLEYLVTAPQAQPEPEKDDSALRTNYQYLVYRVLSLLDQAFTEEPRHTVGDLLPASTKLCARIIELREALQELETALADCYGPPFGLGRIDKARKAALRQLAEEAGDG